MASIYEREGVWYAKAQRKGRTYRQSLHTRDEAEARGRLGAWLKRLDAEIYGRGLGEHTVREAAERFVEEHMITLKPKAVERYFTSLKHLNDHFGEMRLSEISRRDLYAFEQARRKMRSKLGGKISPVTIKRDLACLSSIFSCAEVWEWMNGNPVKAYLRGRRQQGQIVESAPRNRYLDHAEERAILQYAGDNIRDALVFAIDTGLRAQEQWSVRRKDIDLVRRRVTVRAENAKNGKERTIPLLDRAYEIVRRRMAFNRDLTDLLFWREEGVPVEHTWAWRTLQEVAVAANVKEITWHDLRRTCGCRLLQDHKMEMSRVSKWLGHSSIKVTERHYAFLYVDDLERAIKKNVVQM
jgi:integrase/recombinase XerD